MSEDPAVKLYVPGRRTRSAAKIVLVSGLILLTILGSIGTVLPGILNALGFGPTSNSALAPQELRTNSTSPANIQTGVSLPPGTIQYGSHDGPSFAQAVDSSISPRLLSTSTALSIRHPMARTHSTTRLPSYSPSTLDPELI